MKNWIIVSLFLVIPLWMPARFMPQVPDKVSEVSADAGLQRSGEFGYPFIRNFNASTYGAHAQNFAITVDSKGMVYAGNFAGVLQYDGESWRLIQTTHTRKVSALAMGQDNRIYVGARGEIGYLAANDKGSLQFEPITIAKESGIPEYFDVLNIVVQDNAVLFITTNHVITYQSGKTHVWTAPSDILGSFLVNGTVYMQLKGTGIAVYRQQKINPVNNRLGDATLVKAMLPRKDNSILVATGTQGLFLLSGNSLVPFSAEANEILTKNPVTSGVRLSNGTFALGTSRSGVIIIDEQGNLLQIIDKNATLQNSYVQQLYTSDDNILWVALNNGVSLIETPSPLSYFDDNAGLKGSVNQIIRHKGTLFAGTYEGLFYYDKNVLGFRAVEGIISSCWALKEAEGILYAATSQGVFRVQNRSAILLKDGFALDLAASVKDRGYMYVCETEGLFRLSLQGNRTEVRKITGVAEGIAELQEDSNGNIWGRTIADKLFRYSPGSATVNFVSVADSAVISGLKLNDMNGNLAVAALNGMYIYDDKQSRFHALTLMQKDDKETSEWFSLLQEDHEGNIWTTKGDEKNVQLLKHGDAGYTLSDVPFKPVAGYVIRSIYPESNGIIWLGGPDGLIRYDASVPVSNTKPFPVRIRKIVMNSDSVCYTGDTDLNSEYAKATNGASDEKRKKTKADFTFSYSNNSLLFEFSAPFHAASGEILYSYMLEGFDETWSEWNVQSVKEYTNIPGGSYVFKVRARNMYDELSEQIQVTFVINDPWYASIWAILLYVIIAGAVIYAIVLYRNRKLLQEKRLLEDKVAERTAEVIQQKEEIEQQSQELAGKNDELEKINSAIKSINAETNYDNLVQALLEKMRIIRSSEKSLALMYDKGLNAFRFKAVIGYPASEFEQMVLTSQQAEIRYLESSEEIFEDIFVKRDFESYKQFDELSKFVVPKAALVLVIRIENQMQGMLIFENFSRETAFEQRDFSLLRNSKEHLVSAIIRTGIMNDLQKTLNNLKETQDQLVQSEKLASLGQLTAGIAHEIQNPLNFVNNFAGLSADLALELHEILDNIKDEISKDQYEEMSEVVTMIKGNVVKINEHGKRVEGIVKGMLQHSRAKTAQFEPTDVNNMVSEFVNLAYHGLKANDKSFSVSIKTNFDPSIAKADIIPQELSRVVLNVVNNACYAAAEKATKSAGGFFPEVVISTSREQHYIVISVKDNGTGIPQSIIDKVFNPFFTTKPTGKGTGLGLSLSFDIVNKLHKGKLEVTSKEGEYTEFTIKIPEKQL